MDMISAIADQVNAEQLPTVLLKFALALVLAGSLGIERERRGRGAGLRTHVTVCLGATLMMVVSGLLYKNGAPPGCTTWVDAGRIAAGVITGIGFLGAGTIMVVGGTTRGLTTAAMLWFTAALGIAVGAGFYFISIVATAIVLFVILTFRYIERLVPATESFVLRVRTSGNACCVDDIEAVLHERGFQVVASRIVVARSRSHVQTSFRISSEAKVDVQQLMQFLEQRFPDIEKITIQR